MTFTIRSMALAAGLSAALALPALAEDTIRAVTAFPQSLAWSQSFLSFIDKVNERGKGVVQIQYMGGPEVVPQNQQMDAVKRGVVDMHNGPASFHLGTMPEADAFVGSTVSAQQARENGGFALMQDAFAEKLGVRLLAHIDSGPQFHIYLVNEPTRTADGGVNFEGLRIRTAPIYKSFFEDLGAVPISVPTPDVYTGLERNTFDGAGWPIVAIRDLSWDKFLRYRIDPGFFSADLSVVINPAKWESLSEESRAILNEVAIQFEIDSYATFKQVVADTDKAVRDNGMVVITLEGDARKKYLDMAYDSAWGRMETSGTPRYKALREAYDPAGTR